MSAWKPIREYPCTPDRCGPLVLVRTADRFMPAYLALMRDGRFFTFPAEMIDYGRGKILQSTITPVEFAEIPEWDLEDNRFAQPEDERKASNA